MATIHEISELKMRTISNELARQLGVLRLLKIVQQQRQPISLSLLGAIFGRKAELEERQAVGSTLPEIMVTMKTYSNIFILDTLFLGTHPEIHVRLVNQASAENLLLLNGVLKVKSILKQKGGKLKIKQLSTFFNQQSSFEERNVMGRNPTALAQTILALSSIFDSNGDFISIKVDKPPASPELATPTYQDSNNSDCESQTGSQTCSEDAPISYASAVTAHTIKDDDISRARRTGISKLRNYLAQFGTLTFSHLLSFLESQGTPLERQAVGTDLKTLQATLQGLSNIFAVTDQFVDLITQTNRVNGLTRISHFLKTKGSCEVVQIVGFMGQQGTQEERVAIGKNPQSLGNTLHRFPNIFAFSGSKVSLKWMGHSQFGDHIHTADGFGGLTSSLSPAFLIHNRTRNESIGVDSGYEGSVTFDQPGIDAANQGTPDLTTRQKISSGDVHTQFTMIDVAYNHDPAFKNFKLECLDSGNEFDQPIIGLVLSDDQKWMTISSCSDKVYLVDLEACLTSGTGDQRDSVWDALKEVLQSSKILKVGL